ncbi:MAG TPA: TMEM43 family protein [Luteimonas sp.]|jgi:hypothetical protein|nr:TMEM43 family protein [Luteimonas sp.]
MIRAAWLAAWFALVLLLAGSAMAQDAPLGAPQPDRTLRDPEFGVRARHLGLERRVTMLQWQAVASGYVRTWSDRLIDSSGYDGVHKNPPAFPLTSRRWIARAVTIDGKPLAPGVLDAAGIWLDFRPSFNALPANLAATFQPEGDGLGSAENPLAPQVGDLRIQWRDLVLPPLDDRLVLRAGRWELIAPARAEAPGVDPAGPAPAVPTPRRWPWLVAALVLASIAGLAWWKRRT